MSSTGLLPRHPVKLAIDGTVITTLTADDHGVVSYTLNPAALGLRPGYHALTLQGMLITTTASFHSKFPAGFLRARVEAAWAAPTNGCWRPPGPPRP